ncbi:hypothetical protein [uncultured Pseudomonas sp.]|uniref:hypothetical protein n=1 Tax=uncultured Pseudomonas sp. TaxID=114707 RepID=UPI0025FB0BE3|nr:hypothetical protein [uncultured Pseudomonas sp.]
MDWDQVKEYSVKRWTVVTIFAVLVMWLGGFSLCTVAQASPKTPAEQLIHDQFARRMLKAIRAQKSYPRAAVELAPDADLYLRLLLDHKGRIVAFNTELVSGNLIFRAETVLIGVRLSRLPVTVPSPILLTNGVVEVIAPLVFRRADADDERQDEPFISPLAL